jgi:hypothetical protein
MGVLPAAGTSLVSAAFALLLAGGVTSLLALATGRRWLGVRAPVGAALGRVLEWVALTVVFLVLNVLAGLALSAALHLVGVVLSRYVAGDAVLALLAAAQATAWQWWTTAREV